jgi:hypothetical protein
MAKKILFTTLSLILAYNTYKLAIIFFKLSPEEFSLLAIIVLAVSFNILITGVVAFLGFAYPTRKILSNNYYQIKRPEKINLFYKWMGGKYFKSFLIKTFYREKDNKKYFNGTKSGVLLLDYNTKQSEFGHLIALILVFSLSMVLLFEGHKLIFFWMQPVNILLNFYPIILQRKHRIIVERLINRI